MQQSHGLSRSPFYRIWFNLLDRCNNPKNPRYKDYGGVGIKAEWADFNAFREDMYEKYQKYCKSHGKAILGRIDTSKNYNKENAVFLTSQYLALSKKSTIYCTYRGNTLPMKWMAAKYNISYQIFKRWTKRGWSPTKIINKYNGARRKRLAKV